MDPQARLRVLQNLRQLLQVGMWQGGNSYAIAEAIEFVGLQIVEVETQIPAEATPAPEA